MRRVSKVASLALIALLSSCLASPKAEMVSMEAEDAPQVAPAVETVPAADPTNAAAPRSELDAMAKPADRPAPATPSPLQPGVLGRASAGGGTAQGIASSVATGASGIALNNAGPMAVTTTPSLAPPPPAEPAYREALRDAKTRAKTLAMEGAKEKSEKKADSARKNIAYDKLATKDTNDADEAEEQRNGFDEGGEFVAPGVNPLVDPRTDPLSTFAIDVDTGSYTLSRRFLENGAMPNPHGVRVEEWVNAFHYSYADESKEHPFSIHMEGAPIAKNSYVLRVGIQGKRVAKAERAPVHLTFLVDVSGSMSGPDRLPLAKDSLKMLIDELDERDSVGLVTYAGSTGVVLPATTVTKGNRAKIKRAIDNLTNGGGTAMSSGMELAYREAGKELGEKGISRVIILSDGDANIGKTSFPEILKAVKGYVSEGVTMSTVGFGTGNYRDNLMEQLADAGNGNYSYIGSKKDAQKVFVDDLTGTLQVIAKDTKIQVEMNPDVVASYRLIGYENRDIADHDFRNDKVDAGEIGAGHTVTALYEVILANDDADANIATVRVRYKQPRGEKATEVAKAFPAEALKHSTDALSVDGKFAAGVALTAEVFRHSEHMKRLGIDLSDAHKLLAEGAKGQFAEERKDLVRLIAPLARGASVATR